MDSNPPEQAASVMSVDYDFLSWPINLLVNQFDKLVSKDKSSEAFTKAKLRFEAYEDRERNLSLEALDYITEEALKDLGETDDEKRKEILKLVRGIPEETAKKVFNDPVHGHMEIHPLCVKIIDTPHFQRLRYIKQTGGCYFVYPGAGHNRFEHSLGVCHLAGKLARALMQHQPELNITHKDILCVEIAGLCHDLGHGPFSHLFDKRFIPASNYAKRKRESEDEPVKDWKHEEASVKMFDDMVDKVDLQEHFEKYGLNLKDQDFIREQIVGKQNGEYKGRPNEKKFLYEIVANKRNGIDVDRWDYFARDCYGLGIKNSFDHNRFMVFARVVNDDNELQICTRDKEAETVYGMFQTRTMLHRRALQHRVCNVIEIMITDAFLEADKKNELVPKYNWKLNASLEADKNIDDVQKEKETERTKMTIAESKDYPEFFINLNDSIFNLILSSTEKPLENARNILRRIERRQLYKYVGSTTPKHPQKIENSRIYRANIWEKIRESAEDIKEDDIEVDVVSYNFGKDKENPIRNVKFYRKNNVKKAIRFSEDEVSLMLPTVFSEEIIRLYYKKNDKHFEKVKKGFREWCEKNGFKVQDEDTLQGNDTEKPDTN